MSKDLIKRKDLVNDLENIAKMILDGISVKVVTKPDTTPPSYAPTESELDAFSYGVGFGLIFAIESMKLPAEDRANYMNPMAAVHCALHAFVEHLKDSSKDGDQA